MENRILIHGLNDIERAAKEFLKANPQIAEEIEFNQADKKKAAKDVKAPEIQSDLLKQAANAKHERKVLVDAVAKGEQEIIDLKNRFAGGAGWFAVVGKA